MLEKCYFYETNISCYQPGTCNTIMMDDGSNNNNITITEAEFLKNTRECTEQEIISVKQGTNDSSSNTLIYICIIVGVILIIIIAIAVIWYKKYSNIKKIKKVENNIYINNSSDIIIYEKPHETPVSSASPASNVNAASSASSVVTVSHASDLSQSSNLATVLPINVLTFKSMPNESSIPFVYCKNAVSDKIEKYVMLSMPSDKNEKNEKVEKILLGKDNSELPPPPYSKD